MATSTIKPKRGTTAQWQASRRVLEENEWGVEKTVKGSYILRIGDGEHLFHELPAVFDADTFEDAMAQVEMTTEAAHTATENANAARDTALTAAQTATAAATRATEAAESITSRIAQTTGDSERLVMSQNAVTEALNILGEKSLNVRESLTADTDCDNLNIGSYYKDGSIEVINGANTSMAVVACFTPDSRLYGKAQLWFDCRNSDLYYRSKGLPSSVWGEWKKLADIEAVNELANAAVKIRPSLHAEDDMDNLTIGVYYKDGGIAVANGVNNGMARVVSFSPDTVGYGKAQFWFDCTNGNLHFRTKGMSTGEWSDWDKLTTSQDLTEALNTSLVVRASLTVDTDCNTLNIGSHWKDGNRECINGVNANPAVLVCFTPDSRPYGKAQLWFDLTENTVYQRTLKSRTNEWSKWDRLSKDADVKNARIYDGFLFRLDKEPDEIPVGDSALGYNAFIEETWDTLLSDYPDEVTKEVVGTSTTTDVITTSYPIYKYVFTPREYEKTVFLSAGCHGNEYEGFWGLYRFMRMLYDEGYKYPNIRNLRHRVRFVIVPVWNPWGVENRKYNCPLNFPTQHNLNDEATSDDGLATYPAFTSMECQAIKTIFDDYEGELSLWCDMHTDWKVPSRGCYGYAPIGSSISKALIELTVDFRNIIKQEFDYTGQLLIKETPTTATSRVPGYATGRGVPAALIEVPVAGYKNIAGFANTGTPELMKIVQEWYGNVIANMIAAV